MARRKGKLEAAGFTPLGGTAKHYRAPDGKEVSYWEAFKRATGRTLKEATEESGGGGAFGDLYHLAKDARRAARLGLLSQADLATTAQEKALASKTLRQIIKGHGVSASTKEGERAKETGVPVAERRDLFSRVIVSRLQKEIRVERRPGESFSSFSERIVVARHSRRGQELNGPRSEKALLLVVLGRRSGDAEYSVGDTP